MNTWVIGLMIRRMDKVLIMIKPLGAQNYNNGDKYEGQWKNNVKSGEGTCLL